MDKETGPNGPVFLCQKSPDSKQDSDIPQRLFKIANNPALRFAFVLGARCMRTIRPDRESSANMRRFRKASLCPLLPQDCRVRGPHKIVIPQSGHGLNSRWLMS